MTKIMDARSRLSRSRMDSHRAHETQEHSDNAGISNATAAQGDENVVVCGDSSAIQVSPKTDHRSGMQGYEAAFLKLRFPNHQPVFRDVVKPEIQRLGNAQAGNGQQREKRCKSPWPDRSSRREFGCTHQQIMQLIGGEDEGPITDPSGRKYSFGRHLMPYVLGTGKTSKHPEHAETVGALPL